MQTTGRSSDEGDGADGREADSRGTNSREAIRISMGGGVGGSLVVGDHNQVIHGDAAAPAIGGPEAGESSGGGLGDSGRHRAQRLTDTEIAELARVYRSEQQARQLLMRAGFAAGRLPSWNTATSFEFWREVGHLVDHGILDRARQRILTVAHGDFPANVVLTAAWAAAHAGDTGDWPGPAT